MKEGDINYTREAFFHRWNLSFLTIGLGISVGLGFLPGGETLFPPVLTATVGLELLILGFTSRDSRFRKLIRAKYAAVAARPPSLREMYRQLSRVNQRRYIRLRDLEKELQSNYRKFSFVSQGILESHMAKIEGLMNSCLKLMFQQERYASFGQRRNEQELATAIAAVEAELKNASEPLRNIKIRRLKVLEQRLLRFKQSQEQLEMIEAQVATIEDVVKYIHEQSLTLTNPEEITYQLDLLLSEVEETEASVSQIESIFVPEESEDDWNPSPSLRSRSQV